MKYISINDLSNTIRNNIWKIPHDIDFIIGIPRSGMICASMISCYLNIPLVDLNGFLCGAEPTGGNRLKFFNSQKTNKVLVVDDTVWTGIAIDETKDKLSDSKYDFIYCAIYLEGNVENKVDIYLEDVRQYDNDNKPVPILHEWNIFQHHEGIMMRTLFDLDGVFCVNPPDDRNEEEYINYIKNATPLFIPRTQIGGIVTYRISKNRQITEDWLKKNNIKYNNLVMFDANDPYERNNSGIPSFYFKAIIYKNNPFFNLFIESEEDQAQLIAQYSGKQVYCVKTNKMYNE